MFPTVTPEQIMTEAREAAQAASNHSETEQTTWFPCGFASIIIRPARGKFVTYLKANDIGGKNYGTGYRLSSYDLSSQSSQWCQSMNVKADACNAALLVFAKHGVSADIEIRMD